jgi:diguanylate cyclase (GGDEF)-like protein
VVWIGWLGRGGFAFVSKALSLGTVMTNYRLSFRSLTSLAYPGGLLLLAVFALYREDSLRSAVGPYTVYFCFGSLAAAALLSWYHNYARVLCLAAATGVAVWSFAVLSGPQISRVVPAILLPLNFVLFACLIERGVLTLGGTLKLAVIGVQVAGVIAWTRFGSRRLDFIWTTMPQSVMLLFVFSGLLLLILAYRQQTRIGPALLWALAAIFAAMNQEPPSSVFLYTGAAGMILLLGVLEHGYDIAYFDELTGLRSRRAFNEALRLLRGHYAIAICDVDLFKSLNDTYGHDVGDQVLKMIAGRLSNVRGGGRVFRHGGEEFAILFKRSTAAEVLPVVEALREAVAEAEFLFRESRQKRGADASKTGSRKAVKITISIGYADRCDARPTPESVLNAADEALYRAKASGRNCVRSADFIASEVTA